MKPRVSICLPTRNSMEFLDERLESIRSQSFADWNLVAVDGMSDDGTYQALLDFGANTTAPHISQAPRDGIYPNFNRCIERSEGEFVYIATSDDTMAPDCLEKLVLALDTHPDCDIAHCPLRVIDETGADGADWWSGNSLFSQSCAALIQQPHKRLAPLDGILCLLGNNIYSSVTQLLIRRSLFDRVGLYQADWGSVGDFHWNLRAGLIASAIHVPDTWGGWRMHSSQATAAASLGSAAHQAKIDAMIYDVLGRLDQLVASAQARSEIEGLAIKAAALKDFLRGHSHQPTSAARQLFLLRQMLKGSHPAWCHLSAMLPGQARWPDAAPRTVADWFTHPVLIFLP